MSSVDHIHSDVFNLVGDNGGVFRPNMNAEYKKPNPFLNGYNSGSIVLNKAYKFHTATTKDELEERRLELELEPRLLVELELDLGLELELEPRLLVELELELELEPRVLLDKVLQSNKRQNDAHILFLLERL